MQLKQIARDALLKPLQAVSGIVERRHTLPILANVLLEHRDAPAEFGQQCGRGQAANAGADDQRVIRAIEPRRPVR